MFLWVLAATAPARADIGNTPLLPWRFVPGSVRDSALSGRTLYVAGTFDAVAPGANGVGSFVRLGPDGHASARNLALGPDVLTMAEDGAGGLLVARVGQVKGVTVYSVFHQLADGSIATAFQPTFNNRIAALARVGGTVYVGGVFTQANGSTRGHGAAFDLATGALLPWDPHVSVGTIMAISAGSPGSVYIGGDFTTVAGVQAAGLVRLHAVSGAIDAFIDVSLSPGGSYVFKLLTVNRTLYVVGAFNVIAGARRPGVAAIDLTTQAPTAFVADPSNRFVRDIAMVGSRLFIGGEFSTINGTRQPALAELDPVTGTVRSMQFQITEVTALAGAGTTLYVGGTFRSVNGEPRAHLAAIDVSGAGASLLPWNPGITDSRPKALAAAGADVAVLGMEMAWGARVRTGLAAIDLYTGELLPFAPRLDTPNVFAVAATSSSVYFTGGFGLVNDVPRFNSAAVDLHGALLPWSTGQVTGVVRMRSVGAEVVVVTNSGVRSLDAITGTPRPWELLTNGQVTALHVVGTTAYVAGRFTLVSDAPLQPPRSRAGLAAIDIANGQLLPFAPVVSGGEVTDIADSGPLLYLAGRFTSLGGQVRQYVGAVDRVSGAVAPFAPVVGQFPERIAVRDGAVYVAGYFSTVNGLSRPGLAAVAEGTGSTLLPFAPDSVLPLGGFRALASFQQALVAIQGDDRMLVWPETAVGGAPAPPSLLRANVSGTTLSLEWQPALVAARPTAYALDAALAPGAPPFASLPLNGTTFSIGGVPPGLYYLSLRAINAAGSSVASRQVGVAVGLSGCGSPPSTPALAASARFGAVTLQWTPATGIATSYTVVVGQREGASDIGAVPMGSARSFTASAPAGVYYARVVASGPCGVSAPSADVPIVVDVAAPPPSPAVTAQVSGNTVSISWTAVPGAVGYRFEAGTGPLLRNLVSLPTGATSLVASAVPPGTYYVRVVALGTTAESSRPDEVVVIVR